MILSTPVLGDGGAKAAYAGVSALAGMASVSSLGPLMRPGA